MARVEVEMPQMGESVMEGTVIEWAKKVGDEIEEDETLLEIATDKVDTEVPSPQSGIIVEIMAEEGETIEVGQVIAVIETDKEAAREVSGNGEKASESEEAEKTEAKGEDQKKEETDETAAPAAQSRDSSNGEAEGERMEVKMPQMGESVMEGTVIEWAKQVGDSVEEDETLLEIATDKVDTEIPAPHSGTLVEILAEEGETVEVGQTIAIIATGEVEVADEKPDTSDTGTKKDEAAPSKEKQPEPASVAASGPNGAPKSGTEPQRIGSDGRFYSPLVRSIAREEGISQEELEQIEGSGQGGRVSKQDIISYLEDR
ncbi:MAG: biotin/lipoyl-containing protein, partial [Balneolaceae bacterium]|nr:biotin/lipoyl-containing protein [Balneolaceae bacterium]